MMTNRARLLYIINADWYFCLHWLDRAKAALAAGYEVHVAADFRGSQYVSKLESLGILCHNVPLSRSGMNPFTECIYLKKLYRCMKTVKPSLVHTVTVKPNIYGGVCARLLRVPVIASVTGLGSVFASSRHLHKMVAGLIVAVYGWLSARKRYFLLFENPVDRDYLLHHSCIDPDFTKVVPGAGVDTGIFRFSEMQEKSTLTVLFAARLIEEKGLAILVEAIGRLHKKGVPVELWVAGITDPDAHHPISLSQLDNWQRSGLIRFLGRRDDMETLLSEIDVVCLPTMYREGIPRILIEAGACGRPVITSDIAGCSELIKPAFNGFLVQPGDGVALEETLSYCSQNRKELARLGLNARRHVVEKYSNEIVIEQHLDLYSRFSEPQGN